MKMMTCIEGKNVLLRDVVEDDAEFVLNLRLDQNKNKYINKTNADLQEQIKYIKNSHNKNGEYYFIIEDKTSGRLGTVRIYDIIEDDFSWGSWIIINDAPYYAGVESALLIYETAFYSLGFKKSHFEVRKENLKVVDFHKRMGAIIKSEDDLNYYFSYSIESYESVKYKYKKFLK